jgi:hypothetical protein
MNNSIEEIAKKFRPDRDPNMSIRDELKSLCNQFKIQKEGNYAEIADDCNELSRFFLSDEVDYKKISPQMEEAFSLAFPNTALETLSDCSPSEMRGYLPAWKGKYFEVLVRDRLNSGNWIGDIHLEPGQKACLAESATQPGWDLQIVDENGSIADELQLKATDSLPYIKKALERYPDIQIISTDEVVNTAVNSETGVNISKSGIIDKQIEAEIRQPVEAILDSTMEELAENILPFLSLAIIVTQEGHRVVMRRSTLESAAKSAGERTAKAGIIAGVGFTVLMLDGGLLSIPSTLLTRLGIDRYTINRDIIQQLDAHISDTRILLTRYPSIDAIR